MVNESQCLFINLFRKWKIGKPEYIELYMHSVYGPESPTEPTANRFLCWIIIGTLYVNAKCEPILREALVSTLSSPKQGKTTYIYGTIAGIPSRTDR